MEPSRNPNSAGRSAADRPCHLFSYLHLSTLHPFWIQSSYFLFNSIVGFLALKVIGQKPQYMPGVTDVDLFFMSTSAATVSSMSTVNMEVLSNGQLLVLTFLMLVGGEVFYSIIQLYLLKTKLINEEANEKRREVTTKTVVVLPASSTHSSEDTMISIPTLKNNSDTDHLSSPSIVEICISSQGEVPGQDDDDDFQLKKRSLTMLTLVILGYLAVAHLCGFFTTFFYLTFFNTTARDVLKMKGIQTTLFSTFVTVSSFSNCGFVPTNEGMAPFKNNSSLILLIVPVLLAGNTLFPPCLRSSLWLLKKISRGGTRREQELEYLTRSRGQELRFHHLLPKKTCVYLTFTVLGFLLLQILLFCCLEWNTNLLTGMNVAQKMVAVIFQSVNSRHAGESLFSLNNVSPAILVLYISMMYLPPYTTFLPEEEEEDFPTTSIKRSKEKQNKKLRRFRKHMAMSQLSYLISFIIIICITEREKLSEDPLNFNILSITMEVVSAYGNVGFTMGYSCNLQLQPDAKCKDEWYGFAGRWSTKGKLILIFIMFFGRLQKFNRKGGRAWKLC